MPMGTARPTAALTTPSEVRPSTPVITRTAESSTSPAATKR